MRFKVVNDDFADGFPVGSDLYYECLNCKTIIFTQTLVSGDCLCGNFEIDVGYARISVKDLTKIRLLRRVDSKSLFE